VKAIAIVLASLVTSLAAAQQLPSPATSAPYESVPSEEQVRVLLQSDDPRSKAWGAWWTAQTRLRLMEPLLQENLEAHYQGNSLLDEAVMDLTLDAYIQNSETFPPVDLLKAVFPRRPAQSLILFSRIQASPALDLALLDLLATQEGRGTGVEWYAIADLLLSHRAKGFAASLLQKTRIEGSVTVCDPGDCDNLAMFLPPRSIGGEGALPMMRVPGIPPWPIYTLQRVAGNPPVPSRGNTMLVSGPVGVSYHRSIGAAGFSPSQMQSSDGWQVMPAIPTTGDRLGYLGALLNFRNIPQEFEYRAIPWSGADNFLTLVGRFQDEIRGQHESLAQLLNANGFLTEQELARVRAPSIQVSVRDIRATKTQLPAILSR